MFRWILTVIPVVLLTSSTGITGNYEPQRLVYSFRMFDMIQSIETVNRSVSNSLVVGCPHPTAPLVSSQGEDTLRQRLAFLSQSEDTLRQRFLIRWGVPVGVTLGACVLIYTVYSVRGR